MFIAVHYPKIIIVYCSLMQTKTVLNTTLKSFSEIHVRSPKGKYGYRILCSFLYVLTFLQIKCPPHTQANHEPYQCVH